MNWRANLQRALDRRGLSHEQFGELVGLSQGGVSHKLSGRRGTTIDELMSMADALGVSIQELLCETEVREPRAPYGDNMEAGPDVCGRVPVIPEDLVGKWISGAAPLPSPEEFVDTTLQVSAKAFALRVRGDSMAATFPDGWLVLVEPALAHRDGDFVVVLTTEDGPPSLRKIVRDGSDWFLKPLNDRYPIKALPPDAIIVGVVRQVTQVFR